MDIDVTINTDVTMRDAAPATDKARRFRAGDEILGRYVVESELGQGGMGVVYLCLDKVGGVKVAVKGLPPDVSHNAEEMEDVRKNFQLVCALRHPGIAGIRTLESDPSGLYYLVMDVAEGESLARWMKAHERAGLTDEKLAILRDVAAALDYAHARQIIHRDIKPGNVMVGPDGHAQVLDFGLAAQIRSSMSRVSLQVTSQSGTPAYKSPEQWKGRPQRAAADQYALAVIAYRLISGELPFDGDDLEVLGRAVMNELPPEIPTASGSVNAALRKALAKDPQERYPDCASFVAALAQKTDGTAARTSCLKKWMLPALLAALFAIGAVVAFFASRSDGVQKKVVVPEQPKIVEPAKPKIAEPAKPEIVAPTNLEVVVPEKPMSVPPVPQDDSKARRDAERVIRQVEAGEAAIEAVRQAGREAARLRREALERKEADEAVCEQPEPEIPRPVTVKQRVEAKERDVDDRIKAAKSLQEARMKAILGTKKDSRP